MNISENVDDHLSVNLMIFQTTSRLTDIDSMITFNRECLNIPNFTEMFSTSLSQTSVTL